MKFLTWLKENIAALNTGRGTFVYRPVLNGNQFIAWAKANNVGGEYLDPDDMHVTIMYSKTNIRGHRNFSLLTDTIIIDPVAYSGRLQFLGQDGAVVLKFDNGTLFDRWRQLLGMGAVWSYPTFSPHTTLTYKEAESGWWQTVIPTPTFAMVLGPEQVTDIKASSTD